MQEKFTSYQKLVIALLALTQFSVVLDFMVMSPLGDLIMKSMDINTRQFGWAVSAYAFSAGISGLLAAGFADKYDRKTLLVFFYTGFVFGTLCCGLAGSYPVLMAARIVTGIFGGVIGSISMAIISDLFDIGQRGRVMGIVQMGFAASQVMGIPVGLYLANHWGWNAPFLVIVALGLAIMVVIILKMQPVTQHLALQLERNAFAHLKKTISVPYYQLAFATTALLSIGGFMLMPFGTAYLVNNIKISQDHLPIIFMATGIFSMISMPLMGKMSDKIDKFRLFALGTVWATIWIIVYTTLGPEPLWVVIFINILLFVGIMARMVPAMAIMTAVPTMADRGAFMSINASLQQIAGGIASAGAGLIVVQASKTSPLEHYPLLGGVVVVVMAIGLWLMYKVFNHPTGAKRPEKMEASPEVVIPEL